MPFFVIKGTFHVVGASPDGDSVKFKADNIDNWFKLATPNNRTRVKMNRSEHVQLRFEGIDTLETHYLGFHQPRKLADAATDFTLDAAGVTDVEWSPGRKHVLDAKDGTEGYILSRAIERYGRPISFVFSGSTDYGDGSQVDLKAPQLADGINYKLLQAGLAYPIYYEGLFHDLRDAMTSAVGAARSANKGLWAVDKTSGVTVNGLDSITDEHPILPKLFRRLTDYLRKNHGKVEGFKDHMADLKEKVFILSLGHATHFDTVISENGRVVGLTVPPEDLVFAE